jgi:molybdopterin/thiamine biosynthesis adenylyltransferase
MMGLRLRRIGRRLRMADINSNSSNSIYSRHDGLGIIQDQKVAVIGCGGIGSWISLYLGLAGVKQIDIYDSDTISETNLNRFPLGPDKIGANKAIAMAEHIQSLRRDVDVVPRQNFEPEIHREKLANYNWVIVTTDSLKSRQMVYNEVVAAGKKADIFIGYIEAGADGHHGTVTFSPATFATEAENEPGYRSVPVFVGPCTMAASIVAYYVLLGDVKDYERTHRIDWAPDGLGQSTHLENDLSYDEAEDIVDILHDPLDTVSNREVSNEQEV